MVAVAGQHRIADLSRLEFKGGLFEFGHQLIGAETAQIPPLCGGARILGVAARQFGERLSRFELLPDFVDEGALFRQHLFVGTDLYIDVTDRDLGRQRIAVGLAKIIDLPPGYVEAIGDFGAQLAKEEAVADLLAIAALQLAFGKPAALEHIFELRLAHTALDHAILFAEGFLHLADVDLNAVLLRLEHEHVLVDHIVEDFAAQPGQLLGEDVVGVAALFEFKAQSVVELGPEDDLIVDHGDDAVEQLRRGFHAGGGAQSRDEKKQIE